jgi:hypothetical protein
VRTQVFADGTAAAAAVSLTSEILIRSTRASDIDGVSAWLHNH